MTRIHLFWWSVQKGARKRTIELESDETLYNWCDLDQNAQTIFIAMATKNKKMICRLLFDIPKNNFDRIYQVWFFNLFKFQMRIEIV